MSSEIAFVETGPGFYSRSLSTAESSKAVVINWRMCCLYYKLLRRYKDAGNSVCRLTELVRHDRNSVYLAVKRQSNKIHIYK